MDLRASKNFAEIFSRIRTQMSTATAGFSMRYSVAASKTSIAIF